MSIADKVNINTHYTRSVNLERDADSIDIINAYIPTSRAIRTFERVSLAFHADQAPRAWSLVGPYGSGKSSFSVFLSHLLSASHLATTKAAQQILKTADAQLSKKFTKETKGNNGYLKILVTGSPEPMAKRLVQAMYIAAESYWQQLKSRKPNVIAKLKQATEKKTINASEVLDLIKSLQAKLEQTKCCGILFIIDELGKFLEYEARHYGANDIYLLQSLAEHACAGNCVNLYMFVMLHQSFDKYAKGLGENLKNEWSKVQGRFEEVPFLESTEQTLRVVSAAFNYKLDKQESKVLLEKTTKTIDVLIEKQALPSALNKTEAIKLFQYCYPLHPVSAILLPLLCQKVAQNERTLFSYLGSHEEYGLQDMLNKLANIGEYIQPYHIYDYFISNQSAVIGDYLTHRRWAEVVTAIERLGDANQEEINLLKTIGILNIIGSKGGFKASKEVIASCTKNKSAQNRIIESLMDKSIIQYRKFNKEYRVWQGSDFDLESAFQEEINNIGNFNLTDELNTKFEMQPVVARRYTIESGTLRYFIPVFADAQNYTKLEQQASEARIIFYIASGQDDEKSFRHTVSKYFSALDIVVLCFNGSQLREAVAETIALTRVRNTRQELNNDPVAKRELHDRLTAAEQAQKLLLQSIIDTPEKSEWWNRGIKLKVKNKRILQVNLSTILQEVYNQAPIIKNELINRNKLSVQGTGARNKLLSAMLNQETTTDLAIDKFPPEKSIYRAVLLNTGLHKLVNTSNNKKWQFVKPSANKKTQASNIKPVWQRIDDFLASTEKQPKSFADLNAELQAPPYGVKAGLLPILYIAAYIVNQHELAIYENRVYKPEFTAEMLDRFIKRPDEFTLQRFRIDGIRSELFNQYSETIQKKDNTQPTLLELAKPLASFMGHLPEYTQKTQKGLNPTAKKLRQAFNLAKSPALLLLSELPQALGYNLEQNNNVDGFSQKLKEALAELKYAYNNLINRQIGLLAEATKIDSEFPLAEIRGQIYTKYVGLENYTVDTQGLSAFISRLTKQTNTDKEWLENILMFLGRKPTNKWLDADQDQAEYRLAMFSKNLLDLQKIRLYEEQHNNNIGTEFDTYLLRSFKKGSSVKDEVVTVDKKQTKTINKLKYAVAQKLANIGDRELKIAVLAELVNEILTDDKQDANISAKMEDKIALEVV